MLLFSILSLHLEKLPLAFFEDRSSGIELPKLLFVWESPYLTFIFEVNFCQVCYSCMVVFFFKHTEYMIPLPGGLQGFY